MGHLDIRMTGRDVRGTERNKRAEGCSHSGFWSLHILHGHRHSLLGEGISKREVRSYKLRAEQCANFGFGDRKTVLATISYTFGGTSRLVCHKASTSIAGPGATR
jgi:hypothetical protein